jgi:metal-responsive CopG/Arc/MetJ family transcriptional regulator
MQVKICVTLSEELLKAIDLRLGAQRTRSEFIAVAVWAFIAQAIRDARNARDLEIINQRADYLNQEAEETLAYQTLVRQGSHDGP